MNWHYQVIAESMNDPELGQYVTYGIQVKTGAPWGEEQIKQIHDVRTDLQFVSLLVDLSNRHQLSPVHLHDALEDMLP